MLVKYLKIRTTIAKRFIQDELSTAGIIFLLLGLSLLYIYILYVLKEYKYGTYIGLTLFTSITISVCSARKDKFFLRTQEINIFKILFTENLLISVLFWAIDYRFIPAYIIISAISSYLFRNNNQRKKDIHLKATYLRKGSFEWISSFRQYLISVIVLEIIFIIIAYIYNNYAIAQFCIISQAVAISTIYLNIEPIEYIKQYTSPRKLIREKIIHILINNTLLFSTLIILHTIFFIENTLLLLTYLILGNTIIICNLLLKYIFRTQEFYRQLIQQLSIGLFIICFIIPHFIIILIIVTIILYYKAIVSLKELYHD